MRIIILQHIKIEDPGFIKDLMIKDGVELTTIELDEGEKIPANLSKFDAMFCMGGPMDTWMEKEHPWLVDEKKAIKEFVVDLKKPYLGFCLGCQLLGEVVGGKVVKSNIPEIGMLNISFSNNKNNDALFSKFPEEITSLQWHSYEVQGLENNKDVTLKPTIFDSNTDEINTLETIIRNCIQTYIETLNQKDVLFISRWPNPFEIQGWAVFLDKLGMQKELSLVVGLAYYKYDPNYWIHIWANLMPFHYGLDEYSFDYEESGLKQLEMDLGSVLGVRITKHLGLFAEGTYLKYWNKPVYECKFGFNYLIF